MIFRILRPTLETQLLSYVFTQDVLVLKNDSRNLVSYMNEFFVERKRDNNKIQEVYTEKFPKSN